MPRSVRKDEAKREIYEYRREVNLKKNLDPLVDFWKGNEGKYHLLAKLAKKISCHSCDLSDSREGFLKTGIASLQEETKPGPRKCTSNYFYV